MVETATSQNEHTPSSAFSQRSGIVRHPDRHEREHFKKAAFDNVASSEQRYRNPTINRTASAGQPDIAQFPFSPPVLRNRQERRRWNALRAAQPDRVTVLNKWQGQVLTVEGGVFTARLYDLAKPNLVEIAEFSVGEVPASDRTSVLPGAIFYWYILLDQKSGRSLPTSLLWFRRGGKLSKEAFASNIRVLDDMWASFGWADDEPRGATGAR